MLRSFIDGQSCILFNKVLQRDPFSGINHGSELRPWSVHENMYANRGTVCTSAQGLLSSLKGGLRIYLNQSADYEPEETVSVFYPSECDLQWFSPSEACIALQNYEHVYFIGDSLTRHTVQGLKMLLSGNYEYGGMIPNLSQDIYDECKCDGQFSEAFMCRFLHHSKSGRGFDFDDNRQAGYCQGFRHFSFSYQTILSLNGFNCTGSRPTFVLLTYTNLDTVIDKQIKPLMYFISEMQNHCQVHVAWGTLGAQSRKLDKKYPHQTREVYMATNKIVTDYIWQTYRVHFFDFWNLTRNAMTSDGYHYLSDVNLLKAMYILNYMTFRSFNN